MIPAPSGRSLYAEQEVAPTTDRDPINDALKRLIADGGTAMGTA